MLLVFTISVALAISMLFLVSAIPSAITSDLERIQITQDRLETIAQALNVYRENNSNTRLPCPARINISTNDTDFGKEVSPCDCSGGFVVGSGNGIKCASAENVVIGAVPVRTLNLSDEYALDGWGNKLSYAIDIDTTVNLAALDDGSNNLYITGIDGTYPLDEHGNDLIDYSTQGIGAIIISHGKDGNGAFTLGNTEKPCVTANEDGENCDNDHNFIIDKWETDEDYFYDDIVKAVIYNNCEEPSGYTNAEPMIGYSHHTAVRQLCCIPPLVGSCTNIKCDNGVWIGNGPICTVP